MGVLLVPYSLFGDLGAVHFGDGLVVLILAGLVRFIVGLDRVCLTKKESRMRSMK